MSKQSDLHKLQKEWYARLKDEGFEDIEQADGQLKDWSSKFYLNHNKNTNHLTEYEDFILLNQTKADYYRLAEHFLNGYSFKTNLDRTVWKLHSEGLSYRDIAHSLKSETILGKDKVSRIVKRLLAQMLEFNKNEGVKDE